MSEVRSRGARGTRGSNTKERVYGMDWWSRVVLRHDRDQVPNTLATCPAKGTALCRVMQTVANIKGEMARDHPGKRMPFGWPELARPSIIVSQIAASFVAGTTTATMSHGQHNEEELFFLLLFAHRNIVFCEKPKGQR